MTLHRTLSATCDSRLCPAAVTLDPDITQPYIALTDLGWSLSGDGEHVYCPIHTQDRS